jgi:hypothetical protein
MSEHNISQVIHQSPAPYTGASPVKVVYLDGREASSQWGSDVNGGAVLAWRAEFGDDAATAYTARPTADAVVTERKRRLSLGFDYDFGDKRGVHRIGTTEADLVGWDDVTKVAQAAINLDAPYAPIKIVTDTGPVEITAMEWQSILLAAGQARQPIWQKSFELQAMDPIPANHKDDKYWVGK